MKMQEKREENIVNNLVTDQIEYEVAIEPKEIIMQLKIDLEDFKVIKKMFLDLSNVPYDKLEKSVENLFKTCSSYDQAAGDVRGLRLKRSFEDLTKCFGKMKTSISEVSRRNTKLTEWIDKQILQNEDTLKIAEDYKRLDDQYQEFVKNGRKNTGCCVGKEFCEADYNLKEKEVINS